MKRLCYVIVVKLQWDMKRASYFVTIRLISSMWHTWNIFLLKPDVLYILYVAGAWVFLHIGTRCQFWIMSWMRSF